MKFSSGKSMHFWFFWLSWQSGVQVVAIYPQCDEKAVFDIQNEGCVCFQLRTSFPISKLLLVESFIVLPLAGDPTEFCKHSRIWQFLNERLRPFVLFFSRDIETAYQYHVGYDQPIQQPLQQNPHYNVKSPYHINPAYDDPYIPHENLSSQQRNEPIVTSSQHPAAEYPDVSTGTFSSGSLPNFKKLLVYLHVTNGLWPDILQVYLSPYRENPKNYLWLSVLVCLINPFFGLIAIAYSGKARWKHIYIEKKLF